MIGVIILCRPQQDNYCPGQSVKYARTAGCAHTCLQSLGVQFASLHFGARNTLSTLLQSVLLLSNKIAKVEVHTSQEMRTGWVN